MDIIRRKHGAQISLDEKDFQKIFATEKRKVNLKRIGLFMLMFFVIWAGLLTISAPKAITSIAFAKQGADLLQSGVTEVVTDPALAQDHFISSSTNFQKASVEMQKMNLASKFLILSPNVRSSIHLLRAGNYLAHTGVDLSKIMEKSDSQSPTKTSENGSIEQILSSELLSAQTFLEAKSKYIYSGYDNLEKANAELEKINTKYIPDEQKDLVISICG